MPRKPSTKQSSSTAELTPSASAHGQSRASERVIDLLRARGLRITKLRADLVARLASAQGPLSAAELGQALSSSGRGASKAPNKTSVYRELYALVAERVVTEVDLLDGMKRYELMHADGHHHHLICTKCQGVECIDVCFDDSALAREIKARARFLVSNHVLEFFGVCRNCQ